MNKNHLHFYDKHFKKGFVQVLLQCQDFPFAASLSSPHFQSILSLQLIIFISLDWTGNKFLSH